MLAAANPLTHVLGLSHVAIACADLERSLHFYGGLLGLAEHCRLNYSDSGKLMLVSLKISEVQWLELFDGRNLPPDSNPLHQVAVRTNHAEAVRARLASAGYTVPAQLWQGQMKNFGFTVPDPRGITIEFVEATDESWMVWDAGKFLPPTRLAQQLLAAEIVGPVAADAVSKFYRDILGLTVEHAEATLTNIRIPGSIEHIRIARDAIQPAMWLRVDDLDESLARLRASPARPSYTYTHGKSISATPTITLTDPDGVLIHLLAKVEADV